MYSISSKCIHEKTALDGAKPYMASLHLTVNNIKPQVNEKVLHRLQATSGATKFPKQQAK